MNIGAKTIGENHPAFIIAEMSANHGQSLEEALQIVTEVKNTGADAIKLQTYTADTITLNCRNEYFQIGKGTIWEGKNLYDLYKEAYTPWEWHVKLKEKADELGLILFSSPFDGTAVDFLEKLNIPAYKIASCELIDIPLLKKIARTGKPIIMSTGMGTMDEIKFALETLRGNGAKEIALLKCTSAYPSPYEEMNLKTIQDMREKFGVTIGLSDHSMGEEVAVAAVSLGAKIIEKHFILSRKKKGPDSEFSMEPAEFKKMVGMIRNVELALGKASYVLSKNEEVSKKFRKSIYASAQIKKGEMFSYDNIKVVRPAGGLEPINLDKIIGKYSSMNIDFGIPINWEHIEKYDVGNIILDKNR